MRTVQKYQIFELSAQSLKEDTVSAKFSQNGESITVKGFFDGDGCKVRFMPDKSGTWFYTLYDGDEMERGRFSCVENSGANHGRVVTDGFHFRYQDGTRFLPFGTTCYAWTHQAEKTVQKTLESLKNAPFNKVRMCVFPKFMAYNTDEPGLFPFCRGDDGRWDTKKPCVAFWQRFEALVGELDSLGIEADIILFHPYDRWGFSKLTRDEGLAYLDYCVRRLSAYKNVWWSLANEYELLLDKTIADWDSYAEKIKQTDIYGHLLSIHNFCSPYPKRDWLTHCSIQSGIPERALLWRSKYGIPVIDDECGYEGNLEFRWGNLSAFALVNRVWKGVVNGGYCTHGETFWDENEIIWWAKGGVLRGKSAERIAFLKDLLVEFGAPMEPMIRLECLSQMEVAGQGTEFIQAMKDLSEAEKEQVIVDMIPQVCQNDNHRLYYYGSGCPAFADLTTPTEDEYRIEIIDVWSMQRTTFCESASGNVRVTLPSRQGIAVLLTKNEDWSAL